MVHLYHSLYRQSEIVPPEWLSEHTSGPPQQKTPPLSKVREPCYCRYWGCTFELKHFSLMRGAYPGTKYVWIRCELWTE